MNYVTEIEKLVPIPLALKGTETNSVYDYEPMRQIIEDAGMDVVKNVEKFNQNDLTLFTTKHSVTASGLVNETSIVDFVERKNKTCVEIPAKMKNMSLDIDSLNYATEEYPVFYKENGKIFVIPEPEEGNGTTIENSECLFSKYILTNSDYAILRITFIENGFDFTDNENIITNLKSKRVPHNLQTGDFAKIVQTDNYPLSTLFQTVNPIYVIRLDSYNIALASLNWTNTFQGLVEASTSYPGFTQLTSSMDGESLTYYRYLGYRLKSSNATAHIVGSMTTQGYNSGINGVFYNNEDNTLTAPSTWTTTANDSNISE